MARNWQRLTEMDSVGEISVSSSVERAAMKEQLDTVRTTLNLLSLGPDASTPSRPLGSGVDGVLADIASKLGNIEGLYNQLSSKIENVDVRLDDSERHIKDLQHFSASAINETARLVEYVGTRGTPTPRGSGLAPASGFSGSRSRHAAVPTTPPPPLSAPAAARSPLPALDYVPGHTNATIQQHAAQIHKLIAGLDFLEAHIIRQDQVLEGLQKQVHTVNRDAASPAPAQHQEGRTPSELSIRIHDMGDLLNRLRSHMYKVEKKTSGSEQQLSAVAARIAALEERVVADAGPQQPTEVSSEAVTMHNELRDMVFGLGRDVQQLRDQMETRHGSRPQVTGPSMNDLTEMQQQLSYLMSHVPTLVAENAELKQFAAQASQRLSDMSAANDQLSSDLQPHARLLASESQRHPVESPTVSAVEFADQVAGLQQHLTGLEERLTGLASKQEVESWLAAGGVSATTAALRAELEKQIADVRERVNAATPGEELAARIAELSAHFEAAQGASVASLMAQASTLEANMDTRMSELRSQMEEAHEASLASAAAQACLYKAEIEARISELHNQIAMVADDSAAAACKQLSELKEELEGQVSALHEQLAARAAVREVSRAEVNPSLETQMSELRESLAAVAETARAQLAELVDEMESNTTGLRNAVSMLGEAVQASASELQERFQAQISEVLEKTEASGSEAKAAAAAALTIAEAANLAMAASTAPGASEELNERFDGLERRLTDIVTGVQQAQTTLREQLAGLTRQVSTEQAGISAGLAQLNEQVSAAATAASEAAMCARQVQEQQLEELSTNPSEQLRAAHEELRLELSAVSARLENRIEHDIQLVDERVSGLLEHLDGMVSNGRFEGALQELHSATADAAERGELAVASLEALRSEIIVLTGQQDVVQLRLEALEAVLGLDLRSGNRASGLTRTSGPVNSDVKQEECDMDGMQESPSSDQQCSMGPIGTTRGGGLLDLAAELQSRVAAVQAAAESVAAELDEVRAQLGTCATTEQLTHIEDAQDGLKQSMETLGMELRDVSYVVSGVDERMAAATTDYEGLAATTAELQQQVQAQTGTTGELAQQVQELQARLQDEALMRVEETASTLSSLSARIARDYITREQLGAIFQARADMKRAVDELSSVFDTGRLMREIVPEDGSLSRSDSAGNGGALPPRLAAAMEDLAGKQAALEQQVQLALYRTEGAVRQEQLASMHQAMMTLELQFKRLGAVAQNSVPSSGGGDEGPGAMQTGATHYMATEVAEVRAKVEALESYLRSCGVSTVAMEGTVNMEATPLVGPAALQSKEPSERQPQQTATVRLVLTAAEGDDAFGCLLRVRMEVEDEDNASTAVAAGSVRQPAPSAVDAEYGSETVGEPSLSQLLEAEQGEAATEEEVEELRRNVASLSVIVDQLQTELRLGTSERRELVETVADMQGKVEVQTSASATMSAVLAAMAAEPQVRLNLSVAGAEAQEVAALASSLSALHARFDVLESAVTLGASERQQLSQAVAEVRNQTELQASAYAITSSALASMAAEPQVRLNVSIAGAEAQEIAELSAALAALRTHFEEVENEVTRGLAERQHLSDAMLDLQERLDMQINASASTSAMIATMVTDQQVRLHVHVAGPEAEQISGLCSALVAVRSRLDDIEDTITALRDQVQLSVSEGINSSGTGDDDADTAEPALGVAVSPPPEVEQQLQALRAGLQHLEASMTTLHERLDGVEAADALEDVRAKASEAVLGAIPGLVSQQVDTLRGEVSEQLSRYREELAAQSTVPEAILEALAAARSAAEQASSMALAAEGSASSAAEKAQGACEAVASVQEAVSGLQQSSSSIGDLARDAFAAAEAAKEAATHAEATASSASDGSRMAVGAAGAAQELAVSAQAMAAGAAAAAGDALAAGREAQETACAARTACTEEVSVLSSAVRQASKELASTQATLMALSERLNDVDILRDQVSTIAEQVREMDANGSPPETPTGAAVAEGLASHAASAAVASLFTPAPSAIVIPPVHTPRASSISGASVPGGASVLGGPSRQSTFSQQSTFLGRLVDVVKKQSNRLHSQYNDAEETGAALAQVDSSLEEVEAKLVDVRDSSHPAFAETLVMVLEQVAALRYIGSQTHPAIQQMVLQHENRLDQITDQLRTLSTPDAAGSAVVAIEAVAMGERLSRLEAEVSRASGQQAALEKAVSTILSTAESIQQQASRALASGDQTATVPGDGAAASPATAAAALAAAAMAAKVSLLEGTLTAQLSELREEVAALSAGGAGIAAAAAGGLSSGGGTGDFTGPVSADLAELDSKVTTLHSAATNMRNRLLAMQEYVDSTQSMIKDMHVGLGSLHRRVDALEEDGGIGGSSPGSRRGSYTGGSSDPCIRELQTDVTKLENRLLSVESSALESAHGLAVIRGVGPRMTDAEARLADVSAKLSAALGGNSSAVIPTPDVSVPALATAVRGLERRVADRMDAATGALEALVNALAAAGRIHAVSTRNPVKAISAAVNNPVVVALEKRLESVRADLLAAAEALLTDLKQEREARDRPLLEDISARGGSFRFR